MKPLAYLMRPNTYQDIVGQDHLVGENGIIKRMLESNSLLSFILYGSPGVGKTTIAEATCKMSGAKWFRFNASTDTKESLKQIINEARFYKETIVIIDEIHRMKKDIQDYLLPFVESGEIKMIGLTTVNPYHSVNQAIRSRCHVFKLNDLGKNELKIIIKRALDFMESNLEIDEAAQNYLIGIANGDVRTLLNNVETLVKTAPQNKVTYEDAKKTLMASNVRIDASDDDYYDTLSGLQKSIRGSDVDASLHYLAKLLIADDMVSLTRRLLAIAYEDIGLANPTIGPRVEAAINAARELGYPEARLPLSVIVIEMALSPKSNSAMLAIDKAIQDLENKNTGNLPLHLKNIYSFDPKQESYKYPHDYPNAWVNQQYLPDPISNAKYYKPKATSKIEKSLKERLEQIEKWKQETK